ncbi:MAG: mitochondrial fission ELM1 family protein, partial [Desulfofustis sp.]|nr:mitochondrial fission ELM1 family protein [Desulfofustis sp.]
MQTLRLIIFKDGRPGHEKQTDGLVAALARYVKTELVTFNVPHNAVFSEVKSYLAFFLHQSESPCSGHMPDLIMGTGSRTHIPVLACKRETGAKAIVCTAPNMLLRNYFDLCLVPIHDQLINSDNTFATIGP